MLATIFNALLTAGDAMHALSKALLIRRIVKTHSCAGISLKTQLLYVFVYITRYAYIFWHFASWYDLCLKIYYFVSSFYTIYLIAFRYHDSYQQLLDKLPIIYVIIPSYVIGLIIARPWTPVEVFWAGSLFLEGFALLPQFYMLQLSRNIDSFTADYIATFGSYRAFYLVNWIYNLIVGGEVIWIFLITGSIQTLMFSQFFYYWLKSKINNEKLQLP